MNLLDAVGEHGQVRLASGQLLPVQMPTNGAVFYGIRPQHLELSSPDAPGAIGGQLRMVESTGTAMYVAMQASALTLHALFTDRPQIKRGDQIGLFAKSWPCAPV